jgi:hypothetical protein
MSHIVKSSKTFNELTGHYISNSTEINLFPVMFDQSNYEYFLNIFRAYVINEDIQNNVLYYTTHEVSDSDWLDLIAYKYYKTVSLWWVVALVNGFNNPFEDLNPGDNLKILKPEYLYQLLKEISIIASL